MSRQIARANSSPRRSFSAAVAGACLSFALSLTIGVDQSEARVSYSNYKSAGFVTKVPSGNRLKKQPAIPSASYRRTKAFNKTFTQKYDRILRLLRKDRRLNGSIKRIARKYNIHPIHIAGALVGEHTFNYDTVDSVQNYVARAAAYAGVGLQFKYNGETVDDFVTRDQFTKCTANSSYQLWTCREGVWRTSFQGKTVDGKKYPNQSFSRTFFQPLYAGQTFGLGQINPLTALKMTDMTSKLGGIRKISASRPSKVYEAILEPTKSLHYVAAIIRSSIDAYKSKAKMDISENPGVTATLFNLGNPYGRASRLYKRNISQLRGGGRLSYPRENYYGWFVNSKEEELRQIFP